MKHEKELLVKKIESINESINIHKEFANNSLQKELERKSLLLTEIRKAYEIDIKKLKIDNTKCKNDVNNIKEKYSKEIIAAQSVNYINY